MRRGLLSIVALSLLLPCIPVRADDEMDRLLVSICEFTKGNDRSNLRKKIKSADLQLRRIYGGIVCDGQSLLRFAVNNNANEAAEFIVSQIGKDALSTPEKDGKSIMQFTEAAAAADPAKKVFVDLFNGAQ